MKIFKFIILLVIVICVWVLWNMLPNNSTHNDTNKEIRIPDKQIAENLQRLFQERFVSLECLGKNATFIFFKYDESHATIEPKTALISFKAHVKIDDTYKTIIGKAKVHASTSSHKLVISFVNVGFQVFLKEWHFVKDGENVQQYCQNKNLNGIKKMKPYLYFAPINKLTMNSDRFSKEKDIATKLCYDGDDVSCQTIQKWQEAYDNYHSRTKNKNSREERKTDLYEALDQLFAQKYYKRLCDNNVSKEACSELHSYE